MSSRHIVTDYMNKVFNYGGIPTRRVDIIRDLERIGATPRQIDYYLMGLDKAYSLKNKKGGRQ